MSNKVFTIKNSEDLKDYLPGLFVPNEKGATIVFLSGDLGAGKTTLVQGFSEMVGVKSRVLSPTFNILKEHHINSDDQGFSKLVHVDLYRIDKVGYRELEAFGVSEYISNPKTIMFIEWPERLDGNVLKPNYWVSILIQDDGSRQVTLKNYES